MIHSLLRAGRNWPAHVRPKAISRARRIACVAVLSAVGLPACQSGAEAALAAADLAAARGHHEREEALLKTVGVRWARHRARQGNAAAASEAARERALAVRLAELYAGPLNQPNAALETFEHVLRLAPPAAEAGAVLMAMGDLVGHRLGDWAQAARHFEQAGSLLGSRASAATGLLAAAEAYLALGNPGRAIALGERIVAGWGDSLDGARARLLVGQAHIAAGDTGAGIDAYLALLTTRPPESLAAITKVRLAQAHQARGESAQALDYYQASLKAHPNAPMVQDAMARLREQMVQIAPHRSILRGVGGAAQVARR